MNPSQVPKFFQRETVQQWGMGISATGLFVLAMTGTQSRRLTGFVLSIITTLPLVVVVGTQPVHSFTIKKMLKSVAIVSLLTSVAFAQSSVGFKVLNL